MNLKPIFRQMPFKTLRFSAVILLASACIIALRISNSTIGRNSRGDSSTVGNFSSNPEDWVNEVPVKLRNDRASVHPKAQLRSLQVTSSEPKYLDWSLAELERFLEEQSAVLSDSEMKSRIRHIMPDPLGAEPRLNRLLPGSISVADQARLYRKYVSPDDHRTVFADLWARNKDSQNAANFLGDIDAHLERGHLRNTTIRNHVAYYFSDHEHATALLLGKAPLSNYFPNFEASGDDLKFVVSGLKTALMMVVDEKVYEKDDMIEMVLKSGLDKRVKSDIVDYIELWAR